jgi:ketosteroid isomerase-like protein
MKKFSWISLFLLFCNPAFSQSDSLQKEINEQVWKPFIKAFNSNDNEAFSAVHSKDVIRVIQDDNRLMGYNEYFKKTPDSIKAKWGDWKKNIELRFLQRIASADKAFEVGYYKTSGTNAITGEKRTGYGKFHVLLRKENGIWKILMDADAHENTNEAVFITARPME